jgi:hypothetical protein
MDAPTPPDNVEVGAIAQIARLVVEQVEEILSTTPSDSPSTYESSH